jgi:hypothetical protein
VEQLVILLKLNTAGSLVEVVVETIFGFYPYSISKIRLKNEKPVKNNIPMDTIEPGMV